MVKNTSKSTNNIPSLLQSIESFLEGRLSASDLSSVAESFNSLEDIPFKIKDKFYESLSHYDSKRIKRCLDLLEYLTLNATSMIVELISEQKFIELFPYTLSEDELKERGLNLLKLWTEKYQDNKEEMSLLFDFIDNLDKFEIYLPPVYIQKYGEKVSDHNESNSQPSSQKSIGNLIERAINIRDESKSLLEDEDAEQTPSIYHKPLIKVLLDEYKQLTANVLELKPAQANGASKETLENLLKELNNYEIQLRRKLDRLNNLDLVPEPARDSNYKIVVSGVNNRENSPSEYFDPERMMDVLEFEAYKIDPCPRSICCPYYDFMDIKCPFWHSEEDKRRPPINKGGVHPYTSVLCDELTCPHEEQCTFSHNFYEKSFHPLFYKTQHCPNPRTCQNEKYCPYYHSEKETIWVDKHIRSGGNAEENEMSKYDINSNHMQNGIDTYPRNENYNYNVPVNYDISYGSHRYGSPENSKTSQLQKEPKILTGKLFSKLIVRKNYDDPIAYTSFFQNNSCFDGIPFFSNGLRSQQK